MTRPTDAAIARAFWHLVDLARIDLSGKTRIDAVDIRSMIRTATKFDAESPAGTARGSEEVMTNAGRRSDATPPVARGEEGKTSPLLVKCPRCPALMPPGLSCKGNPPNDPCPLRKS